MILTSEQIKEIKNLGGSVAGLEVLPPEPQRTPIDDLLLLVGEINAKLDLLYKKESVIIPENLPPIVNLEAPVVRVEPPKVDVINEQVKRWKFTLNRDARGRTKEIIAEAIE